MQAGVCCRCLMLEQLQGTDQLPAPGAAAGLHPSAVTSLVHFSLWSLVESAIIASEDNPLMGLGQAGHEADENIADTLIGVREGMLLLRNSPSILF